MKIAFVNFSGNVGKSTLAKHLAAPRLGLSQDDVISVETINHDEGGQQVSADQFRYVQEYLLENDRAVIDVGASNIEEFIAGMTRYRASHEDIDLFVIPVVSAVKQQKDTIGTIDALAAIGVPANKVRVVFNQVQHDTEIKDVFGAIFAYAKTEKKCKVSTDAVVYENELFEDIKALDRTVSDLMADCTDYRSLMNQAQTPADKMLAKDMLLAKRLAPTVHENLDCVFRVLAKQ